MLFFIFNPAFNFLPFQSKKDFVFNFFYLVKINKLNFFFNLNADMTFFYAKKHFLLLI